MSEWLFGIAILLCLYLYIVGWQCQAHTHSLLRRNLVLFYSCAHDLEVGFSRSNFNSHILGMGGSIDLEWKRGELDTMLGAHWACSWAHSAWQIHWPSKGSMWNCYSFQLVGPWMGYSLTDRGAEVCCRSLNDLLLLARIGFWTNGWSESPWRSCEVTLM